MKRALSVFIALLIIMSSSFTAVNAEAKNKGKGSWKKSYMSEMKNLKDELKKWTKNIEKRKEIVKKIAELKEKNDDDSLSIFVNGEEIEWDNSPVIKYGNFQLPVKPITVGLGAELNYNAKTNIITIKKDSCTIIIDLVNKIIKVNDVKIEPNILTNSSNNNKTIVLIKFIANILGHKADSDDDSGTVVIEDEDYISINDNDNFIKYRGTWLYEQDKPGTYMGDIHKSNKRESSYQAKFDGTRVRILGTKGPDHGKALVSIDGIIEEINLYAEDYQTNVIIYTSPVLPKKSHTLEVKVTGSRDRKSKNYYVTIDKLEIAGDPTVIQGTNIALNKTASTDSYENTHPASHGNDGKLDTRWCAGNNSVNHWWKVDLGANYNLTGSQITWEFAGKVYKYKIEASPNDSNWFTVLDKTGNTSKQQTQTDSFSVNSVRYVRVTVTGLESECWASFWDCKIFGNLYSSIDTQAPTVPTNLTVVPVLTSQINVSWTASADNVSVAGYKVFRDNAHIATVTNSTTYTDTGLQPGKTYTYAISAFDAAGNESNKCTAVSATTPTPSTSNIALNKTASTDSYENTHPASHGNDGKMDTRWCAGNSSVNHWWKVDLGANYNLTGSQITWEFANRVYKYKIEASQNNSNWFTVLDKTSNTNKQQTQTDSFSVNSVRYVRVTVTGLEPGCWASFKECMIFGYNDFSTDTQAPTIPANLNAKAVSTSRIDLTWTASTDNLGVAGYKIYRNGNQIATVTNSTTYSDTGLPSGAEFEYTISAYDVSGNNSALCTPVKVATAGTGTGLSGTYYDTKDLTGDVKLVRTDAVLKFNWAYNSPDPSIEPDTFSVRWTGYVQPLYSEKYTFYTISDDGIRLWVNNQLVIDDWTDHTAREKSGTIDLAAGQKYSIKIEYFENSGLSQAILMWSSESQSKQVISHNQLYVQ